MPLYSLGGLALAVRQRSTYATAARSAALPDLVALLSCSRNCDFFVIMLVLTSPVDSLEQTSGMQASSIAMSGQAKPRRFSDSERPKQMSKTSAEPSIRRLSAMSQRKSAGYASM